MSCPDKKS
jgi:DNA mismatch repair protein MSH4